MRIDGPPRDAPGAPCPYLPDREFVQRYFFGVDGDLADASTILASGWRRFGTFFFRPHCQGCQACRPVRVDAARLTPSPSQRRVLNKNTDVVFSVATLKPRDEYYDLYAHHSRERFGKETDRSEFVETFFSAAVPSFVTEYRIGDRLAGLGFCDEAADGVSSVYFVFHQDFASRSLGVYSVLRECQWATEQGRRWYYLGYWVQGNSVMAYKGRFFPRQTLDWDSGLWTDDLAPTP